MAQKTPLEEARSLESNQADIAAGKPPSEWNVSPEQVASNRNFNAKLSSSFGFKPDGTPTENSTRPGLPNSLPINPLSNLVTQVSQDVAQVTQDTKLINPTANAIGKADVDATINRLAGGLGSGLNGITAGFNQAVAGVGGAINGAIGGIGSALGGVGNAIQSSLPGNTISSLQETTGAISNVTADIAGTLNKLGGGSLASGIASVAGKISSVAGQINNLLSVKRAANLPAGGQIFEQTGKAIELQPSSSNDWRIRLNAEWSLFESPIFDVLQNTGGLVWPYLPNITFSTKANYNQIDTVHNNYPFYAYKNSQVDDITISGEFSAETESDAAYWISAVTFLKTATKMFYGQGENVGNPPIICKLSGYGTSVFDNVPVIVKNFTVDLKDDVNYIRCNSYGTNTWVPIVSSISVTVSPVYNRERLRKFNLASYARGETVDGIGFI
jgi:hypothetical protein